MTLSRIDRAPAGTVYPSAAAAKMPVVDVSASGAALGRLFDGTGLVSFFDPAKFADGQVIDSANGSTWTLKGGEANPPVATAINGQPAINFSHGNSKHFESAFVRPAGSFSVAIVAAVSATEAADFPGLMISTGLQTNTSNLMNVRYQNGTLRYIADNNDAHGVVDTGLGSPAGYGIILSYDAATGTGAVIKPDGSVISANFGNYPPAGFGWNIGGYSDGSFGIYSFSGKIGRVAICTTALAAPANLERGRAIVAQLKSAYAL